MITAVYLHHLGERMVEQERSKNNVEQDTCDAGSMEIAVDGSTVKGYVHIRVME